MSVDFEKASYRSQVFRLRKLAEAALRRFPVRAKKVEFIHHGENATFKVTGHDGKCYLLRTHRYGYHSKLALQEELDWLSKLAKARLPVPGPLRSKNGNLLEWVEVPGAQSRYCDMFHWIDGKFLSKSISEKDMYEIGQLLARLQKVGKRINCRHRRYWTADGLVGSPTMFGSLDHLTKVKIADQKKITQIRRRTLARIKKYQRKYPRKMGLIHADFHFGNLLRMNSGKIAAIDFDDCGYGFLVYDLVIPLVGMVGHLRDHKRFDLYPLLKQALFDGYASLADFTSQDEKLIQDLIVARKLLMLGWLQSRSDNPRIKKYFPKAVKSFIKYVDKPDL
jgi:Ser/Thr protein kinase RdoA (MazF antagonist)